MDPVAARHVPEGRLRLSRAPTAELASAAMEAQQGAGLEAASFVVVAIPPDVAGGPVVEAITAALAELDPTPTTRATSSAS